MRNAFIIVCIAMMSFLQATELNAQKTQKITNKYSMKLIQNEDGSYSLENESKYAAILDLKSIPELTIPYKNKYDRLTSDLYDKTETEIRTYKTYESYELKIAIDKAVTDSPAPVMFCIHGGGWANGTFNSHRTLARYLAQQHGITCVRISYTLAKQPGANIEVSIADVLDAVKYISDNAESLNVDPSRIGFLGGSAGGHLAACAAMKCKEAKVLVGYAGVYDLTTANAIVKTKSKSRIEYFKQRDPEVLKAASPIHIIPRKKKIAAQLYHGTADITVEVEQSKAFAEKLKKANKKSSIDLAIYENYDHTMSSRSDKVEEIFFRTAQFIAENL